jgi:beta-lactamase regulating signal transducer with metallopeptidase domain
MTKVFASYAGVSVVMAAVTLALFLLTPLLGRRYRAKSLYITWIVVLLGFLIPLRIPFTVPAVTATAPAAVTQPVVKQAARQTNAGLEDARADAETAGGAAAQANSGTAKPVQAAAPLTWIQLITALWLAGAAAALAVYGLRHAQFLRNTRRWKYAIENENTLRILEEERRRLDIRRQVKLYRCPGIGSPMITGLWRPVLLLPDEDLTEDELPLVFRHELIHMKRNDLLLRAVLMLTASLHWFNPAVYLLIRQFSFWQESACDEAVVSHGSMADKQFYSETIIRVIRRQARMQSVLSTTFYGGKNGMKRRITAIMESGGKHRGMALWIAVLVLVSCLGMAFAVDSAPEARTAGGTAAYIASGDTGGTRMMTAPTVNDWDVPIVAYFNGVPVTVTDTAESSALAEWNSVQGEDNWAHVLVGGNGSTTGIGGWIPLRYLSEDQTAQPPTARLTTDSPTGFVNVYTLNDAQSELVNAWQRGTEVTLLGRTQQWYQISIDGVNGFVGLDELTFDDAVQARFDTFLPYRFDGITREEYRNMITFDALYAQKRAKYGGKDVQAWSLEDKAWYGQMEETYIGLHDYYYQMPREGDLQQEQAVQIAWEALLAQDSSLAGASQDDYDFNLTFYSVPTMEADKKRWEIRISRKGETSAYFQVEIDSPSGEVLDTSGSV